MVGFATNTDDKTRAGLDRKLQRTLMGINDIWNELLYKLYPETFRMVY
jgi:hypothetical protein